MIFEDIMKKIIVLIILLIFCVESFAQLNRAELASEMTMTVQDFLDLRLQIFAAQISCGSYQILDYPPLTHPVSIDLDTDLRIRFEIEGDLDSNLSGKAKAGIIKSGMEFMRTAITELLRRNFPDIDFDRKKDIVGYWHFGGGNIPLAKWENGNLIWLRDL